MKHFLGSRFLSLGLAVVFMILSAVSGPCFAELQSEAALTPKDQLLNAIRRGALDDVRKLTSNGFVDPNVAFENGISPLHVAVINNQEAIAAVLVHAGAQLNAQDSITQSTPLHLCALYDRTSLAKFLIDKGANVNVAMKLGITPLMVASQFNRPAIVELLLTHKGNANLADEEGATALHIAAENGDEIAARLLIKHGANVNALDKAQGTPLAAATKNNHTSIAHILKERGGQ